MLPEPPRTSSGYRDCASDAALRLGLIRDAQGAGLSLAEIRSVLELRGGGRAPCGHVTELINDHLTDIDRRMAELLATRTEPRRTDRFIRVAVADHAAYEAFLTGTLSGLPCVRRLESHLTMKIVKTSP
ncbi:MerR family DNA-binding protein [Streptomyces sp. NBC_01003]|uniref:MerR family DNA-binding protein n=1 Tax=Streptomyces sp. NBC_01003 TaxID=2903714 RepID=UPI003867D17F|nr:MerR family DNA-binding protein [Streptomyces sp. NBC_01003]